MLTRLQARVEQAPQFRPLRLGLPLAKTVAVAEDALFGAGFFFVAAGTTNERVELEFFNRFQQGDRLVHIAAFTGVGQAHSAARHGVFHTAHDQLGTQFFGAQVAEIGHFMEVMAGVDHQQRVGDVANAKGFFGALQHHQRILAAREQQGRAFGGTGHFTQDVYGFFFQRIQMLVAKLLQQLGFNSGVHALISSGFFKSSLACRPHSLAASSSHHQRPARKSSPRLMARVQGAQPMLG